MEYTGKEERDKARNYIEPYDTGTYLAFELNDKIYRFNLLDTSPGGMGMLVKKEESEVLNRLNIGDKIRVEYKTPEAGVLMDFEIMHITQFRRGRFNGHHQVGLSLLPNPG
ncbi:MAG: hypothetical protein JRC68_00080 [Deltaproteobacteria bacterium]|nr:hypothetical protein [Deltaproteobacteria bacterium]